MKLNRDLTILLLKQFPPLNLCDPLAGSGIRAIRFAKELKYISIVANDMDKKAFNLIKKNMKHNKVNFKVCNEDANLLLLKSKGFDYIDLDVFGSPNPFLDAAIRRLSRKGILAVTATDTACLSGSSPKACIRKYWAKPIRNENMHELGLRILIRKVQLIGAQYDRAFIPIFSYSKDHYMRVFFRNVKGKHHIDNLLEMHGSLEAGPLWLGLLWDHKLVEAMDKQADIKLLKIFKDESAVETVGYYDIHKFAKKHKIGIPRKEILLKAIQKIGFKVSETHFSPEGIRSDIDEKSLKRIIQSLV
jgi:tRNA (guanine26-N2/guanine27-N2)-dimethyltransferase